MYRYLISDNFMRRLHNGENKTKRIGFIFCFTKRIILFSVFTFLTSTNSFQKQKRRFYKLEKT